MSTVGLSRQIVQMVQFYERRKVQILCLSFLCLELSCTSYILYGSDLWVGGSLKVSETNY